MRRFFGVALLALVAVLAGCASGRAGSGGADTLTIRGELALRTRAALSPAAVAVVELTRSADGRVIADQRIALAGRPLPVSFELRVPRAWLKPGERHAVRGAVEVHGQPQWISDAVHVQSGLGPLDLGALALRPWEQVAFAARLQCGARSARVATVKRDAGDVPRLVIDGERFELAGAAAAPGVHYEAVGDPTTQLWLKGERATLTLRGTPLPECSVERDAPDAVRAHGNEPGWQLDLGTVLRFDGPDGRFEGTAPAAQTAGGVRRHAGLVAGRTVNVTLAPRICRDTMSGMPHPYTAEAVVDGRAYRGCGGEPDALLMGGEWSVEEVAGRRIDAARITLDFGVDGRLAGRAGCNAYTTSYTLTGEALAIGTTATTMASCAPALLEQERLFLDVLARARAFDLTDTGTLVLKDDRGRTIGARRR